MADELQTLQAQAARIAASAERIGYTFALELTRVFRDAERALRPVIAAAMGGSTTAQIRAVRGAALRRQIRASLRTSGYDRMATAATTAAFESHLAAVARPGSRVARFIATAAGQRRVQALEAIARQNLLHVADEVAIALWRSLAQTVFTTRPAVDIVEDLADALDSELPKIRTLYDTQVSIFGRQMEAIATADDAPDQPFLYVGPEDDRTRRFCQAHVDRVYSRQAIDAMDNGQGLDVFLTGGGYNCRHSWLAVESAELRALMDTGQRITRLQEAA